MLQPATADPTIKHGEYRRNAGKLEIEDRIR